LNGPFHSQTLPCCCLPQPERSLVLVQVAFLGHNQRQLYAQQSSQDRQIILMYHLSLLQCPPPARQTHVRARHRPPTLPRALPRPLPLDPRRSSLLPLTAHPASGTIASGEMAEWPNASVLKTDDR